jgi:hypothetical protein
VVAVFVLGCLLAYLWGRPPLSIERALAVRRERAGRRTLSVGVG